MQPPRNTVFKQLGVGLAFAVLPSAA